MDEQKDRCHNGHKEAEQVIWPIPSHASLMTAQNLNRAALLIENAARALAGSYNRATVAELILAANQIQKIRARVLLSLEGTAQASCLNAETSEKGEAL